MDKPLENKITTFLKSQSRNKIVFYKNMSFDFDPIDLGFLLSQSIYNLSDLSKLPMKVSFELDKILNQALINHNIYSKMIAISNLGILLEPDLKQDLTRILEKYSNNNTLFVKWEGEIENGHLHFLSKENGKQININDLSYISI